MDEKKKEFLKLWQAVGESLLSLMPEESELRPIEVIGPKSFMSVTEFAIYRNVSIKAVRKMIANGLPKEETGGAKGLRIEREKADKWLSAGGADQTRKIKARRS